MSESVRPVRLQPGDRVSSKWSDTTVVVERWLGEGANGSVYLARDPVGGACALKLGGDAYALQSEINALRAVGGKTRMLLHADDGVCRGYEFPYYLMAFVPGETLRAAAPLKNAQELFACGRSLLEQLRALHAAGWAFGDMKPENVMLGPSGETRLVDYGGATPFGQAVKQFTELYDRGYWKLGGRKADGAYDLFAFAVTMLEAAGLGGRLRAIAGSPRRDKAKELLGLPDESALPRPMLGALKHMLRGGFGDGAEALDAWRAAASSPAPKPAPAEDERWPAVWFTGAALTLAGVIWWMNGA